MVCKTTAMFLTRLGYSVFCAVSGDEAWRKFGDRLNDIDVFIIDMIMPGMGGDELHTRIKKIKPAAKTLLCSGYAMNQSIQDVMNQGCSGFLQKPFKLEELSKQLKSVLTEKSL